MNKLRMNQSSFVYVTYIRSTPEKLWHALTDNDLLQRYWMGTIFESDWQIGSPWRTRFPNGRLADFGEIVESVAQKRLVLSWRNDWDSEFRAEGYSRCIYEIEPMGQALKLTITHSTDLLDSKLIASVSGAWPICLSNLKSLLETGQIALADNPRHGD